MILFAVLLGGSIYSATKVEDGLDLGDVLPRGTKEHAAIVAQTTYFAFFDMYIATTGNFLTLMKLLNLCDREKALNEGGA